MDLFEGEVVSEGIDSFVEPPTQVGRVHTGGPVHSVDGSGVEPRLPTLSPMPAHRPDTRELNAYGCRRRYL